jgi:hypothetical protein
MAGIVGVLATAAPVFVAWPASACFAEVPPPRTPLTAHASRPTTAMPSASAITLRRQNVSG